MTIKNKPTFDPYSLSDFETTDALKSGLKTWRTQKWSCLGVTTLAMLPILTVMVLVGQRYLTLFVSAMMIPFCVAVISPLVARDARGLTTDVKTRLHVVLARFPLVTLLSLIIASIVAAPALILLVVSLPAAYFGLFLGVLAASPMALAIPVCVVESTGLLGAIQRSLFLLRGRFFKSAGAICICVAIASLATALRFFHISLELYTVLFEPVLVAWASVGIGTLYLHLYDH